MVADDASLRQQLVSGMAASAILANAAVAPVSLAQEVYGVQQDILAESILPEVSGDDDDVGTMIISMQMT